MYLADGSSRTPTTFTHDISQRRAHDRQQWQADQADHRGGGRQREVLHHPLQRRELQDFHTADWHDQEVAEYSALTAEEEQRVVDYG